MRFFIGLVKILKILFITDNFPPETNAPASRTFEHVSEWAKQGAQVSVITCAPNFPTGKVFPGYKNVLYSKKCIDGINIVRVKTYMAPNSGIFKRILDFMSFMIMSSLAGILMKKHDVVIATSPQFFTGISGWFVSKLKGSKFIFEVRDIWPASLRAVGYNKFEKIFSIFEWIEFFLYRNADAIVVVTQSFREEISKRGIDDDKIEVVMNGVDTTVFDKNFELGEKFREKYNLKNKFVVGYIGTLGMSHALKTVIEVAETLNQIQFVLIGNGTKRDELVSLIRERALENIALIPPQQKEEMPSAWNACDIALVTLNDHPLFKTVIPSKIFECIATGTPIILSTPEGEAKKIVEENAVGLWCEPENVKEMREKILTLYHNIELRTTLSKNGRRISNSFERKKFANDMLSVIKKLSND